MTAATVTREEQIEEYVRLHALALFIGRIIHPESWELIFDEVLPKDVYPSAERSYVEDSIARESQLLGELWPRDEDVETEEYDKVIARAALLTAELLMRAAVRSDFWMAEAAQIVRGTAEAAR